MSHFLRGAPPKGGCIENQKCDVTAKIRKCDLVVLFPARGLSAPVAGAAVAAIGPFFKSSSSSTSSPRQAVEWGLLDGGYDGGGHSKEFELLNAPLKGVSEWVLGWFQGELVKEGL